jgi:hypothetical protein
VHKPTARNTLLILAALIQAGFLLLFVRSGWNHNIPFFLTIFFACFCLYLIAATLAYRNYFESASNTSVWIFAAAVIFRLTLVWCPPTLSEDFYRYVWDGRIQTAGHSPYDLAPRDPILEPLRNENYDKIGHKQFYTPYPPAAQNVFHVLAISGSNLAFKFGFVLFDLLLIEMIRRLLRDAALSPALLLIYAWHPLVVIEFAGSAHMDVISIALMFAGILLVERQNSAAGGVALAAAILTKYLPVFSLPWLLRKGRSYFALSFILAAGLLVLQFYTPDLRMFRGVAYFYRKWWFNDSLFGVLYHWLGGAERARFVGGTATLLACAWCYFKQYPLYRSMLIVFGTVLIVSPVVHPWYVLWIVPLLVFHQNTAWLFFSGWVAISYLILYIYPVGVWEPVLWLKLMVYVPFYALLATGWFRNFQFPRVLQSGR